jgi:hypothetical protein
LLARLQVPVATIVSSRYCRAVESAERIAEAADMPPAVTQSCAMALRGLVSTAPPPRSNTLLVTHRANVSQAFDTADVGDGELWVFKPLPGSRHELVERVQLLKLSALMRSLNTRHAAASQ